MMDHDLQALVDFNASTPALPIVQMHAPQCLAPWQRALASDWHSQEFKPTHNVHPNAYLLSVPSADASDAHMPSPPVSQTGTDVKQLIGAVQTDLNNNLGTDQDLLVVARRFIAEKEAWLNEKLRLIEDKQQAVKGADEILSSKTKLWQEYYETVRARDEQIGRLKDELECTENELTNQRKKNRRLAKALSVYMEKDEGSAEKEVEVSADLKKNFKSSLQAPPISKASKIARASTWLETVTESDANCTESRKQMEELFGGSARQHSTDACEPSAKRPRLEEPDLANALISKNETSHLALCGSRADAEVGSQSDPQDGDSDAAIMEEDQEGTQSSADECRDRVSSSPDRQPEDPPLDERSPSDGQIISHRLQQDYLLPMDFALRPVIQHSTSGTKYGEITALDSVTVDSLCQTFELLRIGGQQRRAAKLPGQQEVQTCCWHWVHRRNSRCRWTVDDPGLFTCRPCFNAHRACIIWRGNGVWDVLPLPPQVRRADATYADSAYYIHEHHVSHADMKEVWQANDRSEKKRTAP